MQHPDLNYLINRELRRDRELEASRQRRIPASINPVRLIAGRALIALGTRIAARPRPHANQPVVTGVPVAARIDA